MLCESLTIGFLLNEGKNTYQVAAVSASEDSEFRRTNSWSPQISCKTYYFYKTMQVKYEMKDIILC